MASLCAFMYACVRLKCEQQMAKLYLSYTLQQYCLLLCCPIVPISRRGTIRYVPRYAAHKVAHKLVNKWLAQHISLDLTVTGSLFTCTSEVQFELRVSLAIASSSPLLLPYITAIVINVRVYFGSVGHQSRFMALLTPL